MRKSTCSKCDAQLGENRIGKYGYCNACHAEWMRLHRPKHSELNPEQKHKSNCRSYLHVYVKRGKVTKKNTCDICGVIGTQAHHEDYDQPLKVIWLCRKCHMELHYEHNSAVRTALEILKEGSNRTKEPAPAK